MRYLSLLVLVSVLISSCPAQADLYLGAIGGVTKTGLNGNSPPKVGYSASPGIALGLVTEFDVATEVRLSLQPMYIQRNTKVKFEVPNEEEKRDSLEVKLNYLSLPVLVKFMAAKGRTYFLGGLNVGYLLDGTLENPTNGDELDLSGVLNSIDLAAVAGFGVVFPVGKPSLTVELRYEQSIINASDTSRDTDGDDLPQRIRSSGFEFLAGILIPIGVNP